MKSKTVLKVLDTRAELYFGLTVNEVKGRVTVSIVAQKQSSASALNTM